MQKLESLEAVHTHTHTHMYFIKNKYIIIQKKNIKLFSNMLFLHTLKKCKQIIYC